MTSVSALLHIPKIELHAHLSGSLSDGTLEKLLKQSNLFQSKDQLVEAQSTVKLGNQRSLAQCFQIFKIIHKLTNNVEAVRMMTYNVVKEFQEDNVLYLELRTTPKSVPGAYTKQEYLEGVLESLRDAEKHLKILVRLLVSIDRERGINDAWNTLEITKEFLRHEHYGKYICGIDVSGNPNVGSLIEYLPVLKEAKGLGLKLALHLMEVNTDTAFDEAEQVLNEDLVERIGHGTFLHPLSGGSETLTNIVKKKKIPLEICITSNVKSGSTDSLETHHVNIWKEENHPFAICTDDKGVFSTTLSEEMALYKQAIGGNLEDIKLMTMSSLQASFLESPVKEILMKDLNSIMNNIHA